MNLVFYKNISSNKNCDYNILISDNNKMYFQKNIKDTAKESIKMLENEKFILTHLKQYDKFPKIIDINYGKRTVIYNYIYGVNLYSVNTIDTKSVINIILKIISLLEIIHDKKIVHCDLKPSNIIINKNNLYLIDFGIAQYKGKNDFIGYGSVRYCSPEQIKEQPIDNRSDIYSLGIILYELITEKQIFSDKSKKEILEYKLNDNLPKISDCIINVNKELEDIYIKATSFSKEDRYSNVLEMKKDLEKFLKNL